MPPHCFFATSLITVVSIIISAQRVPRLALLVVNSPPLVFVASSDVSWPMHLEASLPFQVQSFQKWSAAPMSSFTSEALPPLKYIWDFFPLFTNRASKETFLGWASSYTIVNVWSRPDAHALQVHLPPLPVRRSTGSARGGWLQLTSTYVRGISLNIFHGEVVSGQTPAVALSSVHGRPYLFSPLNVFSTLCFYRTVEFISHWFTFISSNLTCSCLEF